MYILEICITISEKFFLSLYRSILRNQLVITKPPDVARLFIKIETKIISVGKIKVLKFKLYVAVLLIPVVLRLESSLELWRSLKAFRLVQKSIKGHLDLGARPALIY